MKGIFSIIKKNLLINNFWNKVGFVNISEFIEINNLDKF